MHEELSDFTRVRELLLVSELGYRRDLSLISFSKSDQDLSFLSRDLTSLPLKNLLMLSGPQLLSIPGLGVTKLKKLRKIYSHILEEVRGYKQSSSQTNSLPRSSEKSAHMPGTTSQGNAPLARAISSVDNHYVVDKQNGEALAREALMAVGLWELPVGRVLRSLKECGWSIGNMSYEGLFSRYSYSEIMSHRRKKLRPIAQLLSQVHVFVHAAEELDVAIEPIASNILKARNAIRDCLNSRRPPTTEDFTTKVLEPLLRQIEIDCGEPCGEIVRIRLGMMGTGRSYREIATQVELTPGRIGQLLFRARESIQIRWREGEYLFDDLCELLQDKNGSFEAYRFCYKVFDTFYPDRLALREVRSSAFSPENFPTPSSQVSPPPSPPQRDISTKVQAQHIHPAILDLMGYEDDK